MPAKPIKPAIASTIEAKSAVNTPFFQSIGASILRRTTDLIERYLSMTHVGCSSG
jgi:hypothetical protein